MSEVVKLVFRNKRERDYFMGQLSDGWGENHCELKWSGEFHESELFQVSLSQWDLNEIERHELIDRKFGAGKPLTKREEERLEELQEQQ